MNSLKPKLLLIGASTGGPGLIEPIITSIVKSFDTSIILAQHMNSSFLHSFAKRLNRINTISEVVFSQESVTVEKNKIYLLSDTAVLKQESYLQLKPLSNHADIYHPTIDELFISASKLTNYEIRAYLLSGIGADGAKGLLALKNVGYTTIAQDEATSVVYGMPKAALEMDAVSKVLSIDDIIKDINVFLA